MNVRSLLTKHQSHLALVVGNGINLYGPASDTNSWHDLLVSLAQKYLPKEFRSVPDGISLTEFYDVLEIKSMKQPSQESLQRQFCALMSEWKFYDHHQRIVSWAKHANAPILTTNFEQVLSDAGGCRLYRTQKGGFTDYYPWESYFGTQRIDNPAESFGIWHINGMQHYHRSVRLGLTHYMGSVERARGWLHKGNESNLFYGKDRRLWKGFNSWLHIVFNCPLLIFGLGLEENEVFFRWLLIERARYFNKFPEREQEAWYITTHDQLGDGKRFFLEGVGIQCLNVESHDDIYGETVWNG